MPGQRYVCELCGVEQVIAEDPDDGPQSIRIGCDQCQRVTPHLAVGRSCYSIEWFSTGSERVR